MSKLKKPVLDESIDTDGITWKNYKEEMTPTQVTGPASSTKMTLFSRGGVQITLQAQAVNYTIT